MCEQPQQKPYVVFHFTRNTNLVEATLKVVDAQDCARFTTLREISVVVWQTCTDALQTESAEQPVHSVTAATRRLPVADALRY
jgi:hypothetical protein